ncbi:MAG: hypothetical protein EZS28_048665, partial [Streblomastix strix]
QGCEMRRRGPVKCPIANSNCLFHLVQIVHREVERRSEYQQPYSLNRIITIPSIRIPEQLSHIKCKPFVNKHSLIYFATAMESIMQQIGMKTDIRIINYVVDIILLHQNKEYLRNMTQKVIDTLKYFGFTMNTEKSEIEPNQSVIFLGWQWNLAYATAKTKLKKRLLLLHDLYNMRRWIKTGTEITASFFLNTMDHQKTQAAGLRGWNTTMIMNKTAIPDINCWIAKLRANIPARLIQILSQITVTKDAAPIGLGSTLEKELEIIAMAHGTWNKRQAKPTINNREINARYGYDSVQTIRL